MRRFLAAAVVIGVVGCGGSGDQTKAAAKCLRNALANQALDSSNTNCGDATAANVASDVNDAPNVTCTRKAGNEYVCHATAGSFDPLQIGDHFYDVVFDGKTITFQQTQ